MARSGQSFIACRLLKWLCHMVLQNIPTPENLLLIRKLATYEINVDAQTHTSFRGEYGMGTMANELSLGCDCLGQIHYLVRSSPFHAQ
jgi:hypothetical protein